MKSLYEYENYRDYLKDFYIESKKTKPYFNYRYFAKKSGVSSPMHLKLVTEGHRNLSAKSIQKFLKGLELKGKEADYFENLVLYCQASTPSEKAVYLTRLSSAKTGNRAKKLVQKEQSSLFSKWYVPIIYEMTRLSNFEEDPKWIAEKLDNEITPAQASKALQGLLDEGLVKKDFESNRLMQNKYITKTDDEVENLLIRQFQKKMINLAEERVDQVPIEDREFGFVLAATTEEQIHQAKKMVKDFIQEMNEALTPKTERISTDRLYHLNIQFHPVLKK